jgi:hypothetical protein
MITNETRERRFRHVVSLGGTCKLAGMLRSYGLRDGSYPFDWNVGSPDAVLRLIDTGFEDFLRPGSLVLDDGVVCDTGSGVCMPNDFDVSRPLDDQVEAVRARYARRVERFREATSEPTLFLRRAWGDDELQWLLAHQEEALAILRRSHPGNGLVIVTGSEIVPDPAPLPVLGIDDPGFRRLLLRLGYPLRLRLKNLLRHHGPILLATLRARLAVRTRARRLADRLGGARGRRDDASPGSGRAADAPE